MSDKQRAAARVISAGTVAPDFSVVDVDGELFRLSSLSGKAHALLVLNRGFK